MISRNLAGLVPVTAVNEAGWHTCAGVSAFCTCQPYTGATALAFGLGGRIIDRLGLVEGYAAVAVVPTAAGNRIGSTTCYTDDYAGVATGIQHSSTTCLGGFTDYSTENWASERALVWVTTATSTGATGSPAYNADAALLGAPASQVLTTGRVCSSSTGYLVLGGGPLTVVPTDGMKRFIRVIVSPHIETTGCGGTILTAVGASLIFGYADSAKAGTAIRGRIHVTSACTT